jgi:hypothetical protein
MAIGSELDYIATIDFQLSNLWDFIIVSNPSLATSNLGNLADVAANSAVGTLMKFKITTCNLPLPGLNTEGTKIGKKHYVSREYEGDFQITIMEDTFFSSYNYFDSWMKLVYDFDNQVWKKNPPSRTGMLLYYASNLPIPTATFMYENLKIRGIENVSQQRSTSEALTLTVNLTFEKVSMASTSSGVTSALNALSNI